MGRAHPKPPLAKEKTLNLKSLEGQEFVSVEEVGDYLDGGVERVVSQRIHIGHRSCVKMSSL